MSPNHPSDAKERAITALEDRFEFLAELGSGAAGTVYRAQTKQPIHELPVGALVAVKVLRAGGGSDADARHQLAREADIGESIRSDFVIRIHAADGFDGDDIPAHLVMEYVEGRTLREFLEEAGQAQGALVRRIGEDAALGLDALHREGIVHRDVKPENLLLTDDSQLKLMDLGLAHGGGDARYGSSGGFHGSFAYAAPEVLAGRPHTPAADLYALGVVLFEVTTGRHPFGQHSNSPDEMMHAHLAVTPPRVSHFAARVSPLLDLVIGELLEKDPHRRLGPAREVAQILELGELSPSWRRHEQFAPVLASRRRLQTMRRVAQTRFVDRDTEQRRLDRALREARRSRGQVLQITGSPGVGRRRMCDEWIHRRLDDKQPPRFLGGRAERRSAEVPATPFPQMLIDYFLRGETAQAPRSRARFATRVTAEFGWNAFDAERLADVAYGMDPDLGEATRAELIVRALLAIIERGEVTILRIDRAERLHGAAAQVVRALVDTAAELPLLMLLVGPTLPLAEPVAQLAVPALPLAAFLQLGRDLFRAAEAPTELLTAAHASLTGNAHALITSLEQCESDGLLHGRPGDYHGIAASVTELRPTRTAMDRLTRRLAAQPDARRYVLQTAAVLGRQFEIDDVVELSGRPELEVLEALSSFDRRVVHTQGTRGTFAHRDHRRAVLTSTPHDVRRRLHRMAGWMLEDRGAPALEIGMHLSRAMLDRECVEPLLQGLERLVATGRRRGALRIAERIRLHLDRLATEGIDADPQARQRLRLLLAAGPVHARIGNVARAHDELTDATRLAQRLGDPAAKADALVMIADFEQASGHFLAAIQMLTRVEASTADNPRDSERLAHPIARAYGLHSRVMAFQGHADDAVTLARRGLELAPDDELILRAHLEIDLARWRALHTHFAKAADGFARAAELAERSGDIAVRMRLQLHQARLSSWLGDRKSGERELLECVELARRADDAPIECRALLFLGEMRVLSARDDDGVLAEAIESAARIDDKVTVSLGRALQVLGGAPWPTQPIDDLEVPLARLAWALARSIDARRRGDSALAARELRIAIEIERDLRTPLPLRLVLLRASGREAAARRLPESVVARIPRGYSRRKFLAGSAGWRVN